VEREGLGPGRRRGRRAVEGLEVAGAGGLSPPRGELAAHVQPEDEHHPEEHEGAGDDRRDLAPVERELELLARAQAGVRFTHDPRS
jgi:hypothetical protein